MEFGDDQMQTLGAARVLLGGLQVLPGYADARTRALALGRRVRACRGKDGVLCVPPALDGEILRAQQDLDAVVHYYTENPEGIAIRAALLDKHVSLWPGRIPPLGELRGAEEAQTRAWFCDFGRLERACERDGWTVGAAEDFEALKEKRRNLIRAYRRAECVDDEDGITVVALE